SRTPCASTRPARAGSRPETRTPNPFPRSGRRSASATAGRADRRVPRPRRESRRARSHRVELEVQRFETAQHVDRRVVIPPGFRGTVLGIGDPDVGHAVEDALEADPTFGPGERRADARVDPEAESHVVPAIRAIDPEFGRLVELPRVAVGRAL